MPPDALKYQPAPALFPETTRSLKKNPYGSATAPQFGTAPANLCPINILQHLCKARQSPAGADVSTSDVSRHQFFECWTLVVQYDNYLRKEPSPCSAQAEAQPRAMPAYRRIILSPAATSLHTNKVATATVIAGRRRSTQNHALAYAQLGLP